MADKNHEQLVKRLSAAARRLDAAQRPSFLDDVCEDLPPEVRVCVEAEIESAELDAAADSHDAPTEREVDALRTGNFSDPDRPGAEDSGEARPRNPDVYSDEQASADSRDRPGSVDATIAGNGESTGAGVEDAGNSEAITKRASPQSLMQQTAPSVHAAKTHVDPGTQPDGGKRRANEETDGDRDDTAPKFVLPRKIGRYSAEKIIGQGGFGFVFLAYDSQLDRRVALKVPDPMRLEDGWDLENYSAEARTVAQLDHPNIVPIYDVGEDADFGFFIVSKYVDGSSLRTIADHRELQYLESAQLVAEVAIAIHYAHTQGLVHRDLKPANILIGQRGEPYVTDFGIALREADLGSGPRYTGSPPYMSPEQAAGEGHRVDGRSDVFSLGVVLYELLAGRRPFRADSKRALYGQIMTVDPKPMRQIDDEIPPTLERICMKALAKRATDRYTTAKDFADDLLAVCSQDPLDSMAISSLSGSAVPAAGNPSTNLSGAGSNEFDSSGAISEQEQLRIVPKGMRSFDNRDADFFLRLVPGPRDRFGLPDVIRFWKRQIEQTNPDQTFSVGLIYGPSGCGKSSLVKAGLIPRLDSTIIPIYLEASPTDTEKRIQRALRRRFPSLPKDAELTETMKELRLGDAIPEGHKLLLVLDQFEQWLHGNYAERSELVSALRQCRADRVQCVIMVRDDFWMAATSFMRQLEVRLVEDHNSNAVELFPLKHAKRVLTAFGRAYGALPLDGPITDVQQQFIDAAVEGVAQDGRVVCVRLALLAEMMRHKSWTPQTLRGMGGLAGLGETYLEETFSAASAAPERRYHQAAARAVLRALLPDAGTDIKRRKSHADLIQLSGYAKRTDDFDQLIDILDRQLRLITPTDADDQSESQPGSPENERYYQLSHDFLVPSVRSWLTRKQRETRKGRAELRLHEQANDWKLRPENRRLPTLVEWISIRFMTTPHKWQRDERLMMRNATQYYGLRLFGAMLLLLCVAGSFVSLARKHRRQSAIALAQSVLTAPAAAVPYAIESLEPTGAYALGYLQEKSNDASLPRSQRLRAMCALAKIGDLDFNKPLRLLPVMGGEDSANLVFALRESGPQSLDAVLERVESTNQTQDWALKARYAVVALHLGSTAPAADMLETDSRPDPTQRTVFVTELEQWHGDLRELAKVVSAIEDVDVRSGIILGVASIEVDTIEPRVVAAWHDVFVESYDTPDSTLHAAANWALRHWNYALPTSKPTLEPGPDREWCRSPMGLTLVRVPTPSFEYVGSNGDTVAHGFLVADREITRELFEQFVNDADYEGDRPEDWRRVFERVSPSGQHPAQGINWHDAMMFCNWLSVQEARLPCYRRVDGRWQPVSGANGYRLPTVAEWEYACRAGTSTSFAFGDQAKWLNAFAVNRVISNDVTRPTGSMLPNNWGLFDLHGNVWEWCLDRSPQKAEARLHKGGAYNCGADNCLIATTIRSHARQGRTVMVGMRVIVAPDVNPPEVE